MKYIFKFPDIGEGLDEGTIAEWYVEKGQEVKMGESLVKMETDKVVTDIPSPKSGLISMKYGKVGETINVGDPLVEIDMPGISGAEAQEEATKPEFEPEEEGAAVVGTLEVAGNSAYLPASNEIFTDSVEVNKKTQHKALATPVARAMANDFGLNINDVNGTGPAGRVMKSDIQEYHNKRQNLIGEEKIKHNADAELEVEVIELSQIRKAIARNMLQSKHQAAHMTVFDEVEISKLIEIRNNFKTRMAKEEIKLSYLPFILKATAQALKEFPSLNSEMDLEGGKLFLKKYYNIGIAVDTEDGLVVPVIRNVDQLSIKELAIKVAEIAEKARNRNLTMEDMKNGSFTITNFGSIGGQFAVPVINYPQAAILGIGRIVEKPIVKEKKIIPGSILPLSISVDHRIVDGGEVSRFLNRVMEFLGDPVSLIMG
jgi:pyruvate dehydrogenase E2 component (dihydrolipoamide acetyltransferase)